MSDTVRVINNRDRYYNGVRKGGILEVSKDETDKYLKVGFALLENSVSESVVVKENIVKGPTKKELGEILDHAGVDYNPKAKLEELQALVDSIPKKDADNTGNTIDITALKTQLIEEKIVALEDIEGKTDEEILAIAKENHLTD